jgi:hypothetical protein
MMERRLRRSFGFGCRTQALSLIDRPRSWVGVVVSGAAAQGDGGATAHAGYAPYSNLPPACGFAIEQPKFWGSG